MLMSFSSLVLIDDFVKLDRPNVMFLRFRNLHINSYISLWLAMLQISLSLSRHLYKPTFCGCYVCTIYVYVLCMRNYLRIFTRAEWSHCRFANCPVCLQNNFYTHIN